MKKTNRQKDNSPRIGIPFLSSTRLICHNSLTGEKPPKQNPPAEVSKAMRDYHQQVTWCGFLCGLGLGAAIASLIIGGFWLWPNDNLTRILLSNYAKGDSLHCPVTWKTKKETAANNMQPTLPNGGQCTFFLIGHHGAKNYLLQWLLHNCRPIACLINTPKQNAKNKHHNKQIFTGRKCNKVFQPQTPARHANKYQNRKHRRNAYLRGGNTLSNAPKNRPGNRHGNGQKYFDKRHHLRMRGV